LSGIKIYRPVKKEEECWGITNKEVKVILHREGTAIKCVRLRWYLVLKECKTTQCQKNCNNYTEGTRKRGRPSKRRKREVEDVLNVMGLKKKKGREWRKNVLEGKVHNGLWSLRRRRRTTTTF
jgi:hypothetical protein